MERAEDNLCSNTTNMSFISKQADGAEKVRKDLERALMAREDAIEQLENKHKVGTGHRAHLWEWEILLKNRCENWVILEIPLVTFWKSYFRSCYL